MMDDQEENTITPIPAKAGNVPMASLPLKNAQKLLGLALVSSTRKETVQQELAQYLANADLPLDGCILSWWKLNQAVYPWLAKVARNMLAIPGEFTGISMLTIADCIAQGGSVIVECSLSGGRDLISLCHASLGAGTISKLMPFHSLLLYELQPGQNMIV